MSEKQLVLEKREQKDRTPTSQLGNYILMITPPVSKSYWIYRVHLSQDQYILGFPKFGVIGIGFALEEDWNTNLPSNCTAEEITDHIFHNHKYSEITKDQVIKAIRMIQEEIKHGNNS